MGVEGRSPSLSRQNSDDDAQASVAAASSELRLRRGNSAGDREQGKTLARSSGEGNEGSGGEAAVQSWFQRLDDTFLSPLFCISAAERERQNAIVVSFQSECSFTAGGQHG
jgi:hypothetical protein